MRRLLVLIRHAEARKNVDARFSGDDGFDELTGAGVEQCVRLQAGLELLIARNRFSGIAVAHAVSERALQTARHFERFADEPLVEVPEFGSINAGALSGMAECEIATKFPEFHRLLELYRAGLVSSYFVPYPGGSESLREFESRISKGMKRLSRRTRANLIILVGHRSLLSALLISIARKASGYPQTFFGFVEVTSGKSYGVAVDGSERRILWANRDLVEVAEALSPNRLL